MDRREQARNIVKSINKCRRDLIQSSILIEKICNYYNVIKKEKLSNADLKFLLFIANEVGIPHYYSMLNKFQTDNIDSRICDFDLKTYSSILKESLLHTDNNIIIHKYQKEVLLKFVKKSKNRFFLSASTSFGKTFLVFEILRKMEYNNVFLIFPTIALLSENLEKIYSDDNYNWIKDIYSIHTLSDVEIDSGKNIFIYTPERYLSFIDKYDNIKPDFVFVDEVYKIDNDYIISEEVDEIKENERDVAYRLAVFYALLYENTDALLAGPYIEFSKKELADYNPSFDLFLEKNKFELLDYNDIEIVQKTRHDIFKKNKKIDLDDNLKFEFGSSTGKEYRYKIIVKDIIENNENLIVYCNSRSMTERYAKYLIDDSSFEEINYSDFSSFINHLESLFENRGKLWVVTKALKKGIGIHHGLIPKYIQKEIIRLFNDGKLKVLLSTTTITEGVNTESKNILVLSPKKGNKDLKKFDAKNIEGRAGRFLQHYSGRVIVLDNNFNDIVQGEGDCIKHKNYDINAPKEEIDLFYTDKEYLSNDDLNKKNRVNEEIEGIGISKEIIEKYKVISAQDKIILYNRICALNSYEHIKIEKLVKCFSQYKNISRDGFEIINKVVLPIVKNKKLKFFMENGYEGAEYSHLTNKTCAYLSEGLLGLINFKIKKDSNIDKAVRDSTDFVYNTLKYQVVKYFGAFNLMYKYWKSEKIGKNIDDISCIDAMLMHFEYRSLSNKGRLANDFGVPQKIVDYYEMEEANQMKAKSLLNSFDEFEICEFNKIDGIINE